MHCAVTWFISILNNTEQVSGTELQAELIYSLLHLPLTNNNFLSSISLAHTVRICDEVKSALIFNWTSRRPHGMKHCIKPYNRFFHLRAQQQLFITCWNVTGGSFTVRGRRRPFLSRKQLLPIIMMKEPQHLGWNTTENLFYGIKYIFSNF